MGQELTTKIAGLWTFPSDIDGAPPGSLAVADNIVIDKDGEAEPRRGLDYLTHAGTQSAFSNSTYRASKIFFYQGFSLYHYGAPSTPTTLGYHDPAAGFTNYSGSFTQPTSTIKMRSAQANQNFYYTTNQGVYKLDSYSGTPRLIGAPAALDLAATTASGSWLAASNTTAYRLVWGYTDANQNLILGAPSQRVELTNTSASAIAVQIVATIPAGVTTAHFYQLYRAQATSSGEPSDEMGLVYEGNPLQADINAGFVTIQDVTPDSLRGTTIYTAPSQLGLTAGNEPPPLAYDLAVFKNCMFYGNITSYQQYFITLLGTGSPSGLQSGDTIVVGGVTYTASSSSENTATGQFLITPVFSLTTTGTTASSSTTITSVGSTTGVTAGMTVTGNNIPTGSYVVSTTSTTIVLNQACTGAATGESIVIAGDTAAQSIRDTALSLIRVINRYASSTVYAFYESSTTGLPGQILFQARTIGQASFNVTVNRSTCWSGTGLTSTVLTAPSTADVWKNGLFYSQVLQPESVPLSNYFRVGSADKNILRIIPLRDSLFVLKEDGIFRISGTDPTNFTIWPLDYTNVLLAPESAVVLNNQIFALTGQGVVTIGETGVKIMSHPIESSITSLATANYALLQSASFGVAYETARSYYLFTITNPTDTGCTQYYRYNTITNAWTHGTLGKTCGGVNPVDDKLYLGNSSMNIIDLERKNLTYSDYADYQSTQVLSGETGSPLLVHTITSSDTIQVGSILYQSATVFGTVVATNPLNNTVTTSLAVTFSNGNVDVLAPISCVVQWLPLSLANPGYTKHMREVALLFRSLFNVSATVGFITDVSPNEMDETIAGGSVGSWGLFAWGGTAETSLGVNWGGDPQRKPVRVTIPRIHQRSSLLTVKFSQAYGYSPWTLQGISYIGDVTSERGA